MPRLTAHGGCIRPRETTMPLYRTTRAYQEPIVQWSVDHLLHNVGILLEMCVGSGKTLVALMVAKRLVDAGVIDRVLVITPMVSIRKQWVEYNEAIVTTSTYGIELLPVVETDKSAEFVLEYKGEGPLATPKVVAGTFDLFRNSFDRITNDGLINNLLPRTLIIVDEGHHIFEDKTPLVSPSQEATDGRPKPKSTSDCIRKARSAGAKVIQLTGTPSRYDGKSVIFATDEKRVWSFIDQMLVGYAPSLRSIILKVCDRGVSDSQTFQVPSTEDEDIAIESLISDLKSHPTALSGIRVRCTKGHSHRITVRKMKAAIQASGLKVLVCVTPNSGNLYPEITSEDQQDWVEDQQDWAEDQKEFEKLKSRMKDEENRPSYAELKSLADVVIFLRKADEGLDIPAFNTMYLWGIPHSLATIIQVIGRILRWRKDGNSPLFAGYPDEHLCDSRVVICVTRSHLDSADEAMFMHQVGGWLTSIEIGSLLGKVVAKVGSLPSSANGSNPSVRDAFSGIAEHLPEAQKFLSLAEAEFESAFLDPLGVMQQNFKNKVLTQLAKDHARNDPECKIPEDLLEKAIRTSLAFSRKHSTEEGVEEIAEEISEDPTIQKIVRRLIPEFIAEALEGREESFSEWVFNGERQNHYLNLGIRTGVTLGLDQKIEKAEAFHKSNNRWPGSNGIPLTREAVPGEDYFFSNLTQNKSWQEAVTLKALEGNELGEGSRHEILKKAWKKWQAQKGINFSDLPTSLCSMLGVDSLHPLLVYYLEAIWVPVAFTWTQQLSVSDLATLGSLIHVASNKPKRWNTEVKAAATKVNDFVERSGVQELVQLLANKTLSPILENHAQR